MNHILMQGPAGRGAGGNAVQYVAVRWQKVHKRSQIPARLDYRSAAQYRDPAALDGGHPSKKRQP
jgi:hypothetical protein